MQAAKAQKPAENAEEEEEDYAQFKYNNIVKFLAAKTGLSKQAAYWAFMLVNFVILASGIGWIVRKPKSGRRAEQHSARDHGSARHIQNHL